MHQPAALLFDLDGTLVDSAIAIADALTQLAASRGGGPVDVARTRRLVGRGASVLVRESLGAAARDDESDVAAFRALLTAIPADPATIFPGALAALEELTRVGHPCAVVTNKPARLASLLLEQLGMMRFFGAVVGGDSLAVCKPDPAPLLHALNSLRPGAPTLDCLMIGDSDIDAGAARAAGMPFVLFRGGYEADRCDGADVAASFATFSELPALVRGEAPAAQGLRAGAMPSAANQAPEIQGAEHGQSFGRMVGERIHRGKTTIGWNG